MARVLMRKEEAIERISRFEPKCGLAEINGLWMNI